MNSYLVFGNSRRFEYRNLSKCMLDIIFKNQVKRSCFKKFRLCLSNKMHILSVCTVSCMYNVHSGPLIDIK